MQDREQQLKDAIGRVISKVRKQNKLKFTIFCYENDISKTTLYMIEKGKNKSYVTNLFQIVEALGLTYEEFGKLLDEELPKDYYSEN